MNDNDLVASIVARKQGSAARCISNGDVDGALNEYDDITIVPSVENMVDKALLIRFWNAVNGIDGLDVEQDARRKLFARQWADVIAGAGPADIDRAQDGDADDIIEADGTVHTDSRGTTALRSSLSNPISSIDSLVSRLSSKMRGADANDETIVHDEPDAVDNAPSDVPSDAPTIGNTGDNDGDNDEDSVPRIIDATIALVRDYEGKPVTATYDGWHLDDYGEVSGYVSINGNNVLLLISGEPDSGGASLTVSTGSGGIPYFPLGSIGDNGLLVRTPVLRGLTVWDHEPDGFTPGFNGYGSDFHMTASDGQNGNHPDDHPSHDENIVAPKHEDRTHIIDPAELAESIEAMTAGMSHDGGVAAMNDMVSKFIERYAGFNEQPLDGNGNDSDADSQDVDSHDTVDDYLENAVTGSSGDDGGDYDELDSIEGNSTSIRVNANSTGSTGCIIVDGDDNNGGVLADSDGSGSDGSMSDVTNDAVDDSASSLIVGADAMDNMINDIHETLRQTGYSSDTTQESDDGTDANDTGDSSEQATHADNDARRVLFAHENNHGDKKQRVIVSPMLPLMDTDGNPDYSVYEAMAAGSGSRLFIIRDDDLGYVPRIGAVTIGPGQYSSVILPEWVMAASDPADPTIIVIDGMSTDRESPLKRVIRTMVESGDIPVLVPADDDEFPIVSSEHNSEPSGDAGRLAISASLGKPVSIGNKLRVFFIAPAGDITVLSAQLGLAGVES